MACAIRKDLMLHAYMFTQSGIPMLYSGDEIGQVNDYAYKEDPDKAPDSRYIHRGKFCWDLTERIKDGSSVQGRIFAGLEELEKIRRTEAVFGADAEVYTRITTITPSSGSCAGLEMRNFTLCLISAMRDAPSGCRRKRGTRTS